VSDIEDLFEKLNSNNAPGQEARSKSKEIELKGEMLEGPFVDFSHGDVDAFKPVPGVLENFIEGFEKMGGEQAYTEYRGEPGLRRETADKLEAFTGANVDPDAELIITPGTQGALFLAMGATITAGDRVAIIEPDYFANRKLVHFFRGEITPVELDYTNHTDRAGIDLRQLEDAFKNGTKIFLFSNPNNPTGVIYSKEEIDEIAKLAQKYGVTVIVDELYSRQVFDGSDYHHLCAHKQIDKGQMITIIGPSKTESLSGFRLGVAFGSEEIINRMEQLQAIVSLRAGGYSQRALKSWFSEPEGWMAGRIKAHRAIRDDLTELFNEAGYDVRKTEAGSYIFPAYPSIDLDCETVAAILRRQAKVSVTPGTQFGPQFTRSFRLNFSQDHDNAVDAVKRIIEVLDNYKS